MCLSPEWTLMLVLVCEYGHTWSREIFKGGDFTKGILKEFVSSVFRQVNEETPRRWRAEVFWGWGIRKRQVAAASQLINEPVGWCLLSTFCTWRWEMVYWDEKCCNHKRFPLLSHHSILSSPTCFCRGSSLLSLLFFPVMQPDYLTLGRVPSQWALSDKYWIYLLLWSSQCVSQSLEITAQLM